MQGVDNKRKVEEAVKMNCENYLNKVNSIGKNIK